jgi:hypothetical protein
VLPVFARVAPLVGKSAPPRPAYVEEETPGRPHDLVQRRLRGGTVVRGPPAPRASTLYRTQKKVFVLKWFA